MEVLDKQGLIEYDKKIKNDFKRTAESIIPNGILHIDTDEESKILNSVLLTNADTLGGQLPEYYAAAQEITELDNQLQTQYVSNNESIKRSALQTAGWYRIAQYSAHTDINTLKANSAHGCDIILRSTYNYNNNCCAYLKFINAFSNYHFVPIANVSNANLFRNIRFCITDNNIGYIEVYYSSNSYNVLFTTLNNTRDEYGYWYAISAEATEESAEGCTYYAVTDIPANYIPWKTYSNPNILINSDFRNPINQRCQTEYITHGNYTIDRWRLIGNNQNVSINDGYIRYHGTHANLLCQYIENYNLYAQKTMTVSINVKSVNVPYAIVAYDGIKNNSKMIKTGINTLTFIPSTNLTMLRIGISMQGGADTSGDIDIEWIKLEEGSVATPFVPPDQATELMKCQRYCIPIISHALRGMMISDTIANIFMNSPTMRVTPTVSWNDIRLTIAGVGNITSFSTTAAIRNGCVVFSLKTTEAYEKYQSCSITTSGGDIVGYLDAEIY